MALETLLITTVLPAAIDLVRGGFQRLGQKWAGLTVDEQIKLQEADISKLEAIAKLDNPYGTPSQWVIDLRASFRYIAAGVLVLAGLCLDGCGASEAKPDVMATGLETAGVPFTFIFGERLWQGFKK